MNKYLQAKGRLRYGEMNKTEAEFAALLRKFKREGRIEDFWFEAVSFKIAENKCRYTPDFLVLLRDMSLVVFEVKGSLRVFQDDAKVKCKVFSDKYPLRLYIVAPRPKKAGAGWECLSYTDEQPPINLNQQ